MFINYLLIIILIFFIYYLLLINYLLFIKSQTKEITTISATSTLSTTTTTTTTTSITSPIFHEAERHEAVIILNILKLIVRAIKSCFDDTIDLVCWSIAALVAFAIVF